MAKYGLGIAFVFCGLALSGCALLDSRRWVENVPAKAIGDWTYRSEPFRPSIEACVAAHDPGHLFELRDGGTYETSSFLSNVAEIHAVKACMRERGWLDIPAVNLGP